MAAGGKAHAPSGPAIWWIALTGGVVVHLAGWLFWPKGPSQPIAEPEDNAFVSLVDADAMAMADVLALADATPLFLPTDRNYASTVELGDELTLAREPFALPPPETGTFALPAPGLVPEVDPVSPQRADFGLSRPLAGLGQTRDPAPAAQASLAAVAERLDAAAMVTLTPPSIEPRAQPPGPPVQLLLLIDATGLVGVPAWEVRPADEAAAQALLAWARRASTWQQLGSGYWRLTVELAP